MAEPIVVQKKPYGVELEAGDYYWCKCGRSQRQPFCDGSHKGSDLAPTKFTLEEAKKVFLCGCKHTGDAPFCDGTHNRLTD